MVCSAVSCKGQPEEEQYPVTTIIGERTLAGTIGATPMPPSSDPPLPGMFLCLETDSGDYILIHGGHSIVGDTFTVADVEYFEDDEVEITGTVSETQYSASGKKYTFLEIATIKKL